MARRIHPCDDPPPIRSQFDPDAIAIPPLTALISRWIHRRAVIGFLLLPWLTLVLALGGLAAVDLLLGDGVLAQQWAQEPRRELLRQLGLDLLWIVGALYLLGALPWLGGLLLGALPAPSSGLMLMLICGAAGLGLGLFAGLSVLQPQSLVLGGVCALAGLLYALSTRRARVRPARRLPVSVFQEEDAVAATPPSRPARTRAPAPLPVLTERHDAPTTLPAEH